ncbi:Uncharacterized conserved protein [Phaffia rhodozyma]|uniref:Uncharacterized conserved protein n=1 Tax=Phaffia rhodozyma TaxID=264483 RepID=A0A0F7SEC4_PHARH|nr:Uncharacterized conserved protein [Phaffia rhodozyma]
MPSESRSHRSSHKHGNRSPESERRHQDRKRRRKQEDKGGLNVVDDEDGAGVWIEKTLDEDVTPSIPTSASLSLNSHASQSTSAILPPSVTSITASSTSTRDSWMLDNSTHPASEKDFAEGLEGQSAGGGSDFFTALGTVQSSRKEKEAVAKQVIREEPRFHRREINTRLIESEAGQDVTPSLNPSRPAPGGPGSQWRMTKLRKTYELAESSQRPIEQVAIERYGSMADFDEAVNERRVLDERAGRRESRGATSSATNKGSSSGFGKGSSSGASTPSAGGRFMFTTDANLSTGNGGSSSRPGSRAGFRRPGEDLGGGPASDGTRTPGGAGEPFLPSNNSASGPAGRIENLRRQSSSSSFQYSSAPSTPIPSVLPPPSSTTKPISLSVSSQPPLSPSSLNKLQARVLKARLMDASDAEELEKSYNAAVERAREASARPTSGQQANTDNNKAGHAHHHSKDQTTVQMVPTLDGMGRLYDIGKGKKAEERLPPGNRRKKPEKVETRDPKTGEMLRLNADDDTTTLGDLVRQERFGGGSADQKNLDAELARSIATDGKFDSNLDYMDENADKLARKKMKTDASKRLYAINDYARTKKALDNCQFCPQNEGDPPKAAVIAMGSRVYLACTQTEELVDGHCLIVPMQHTLTTLEGDDDVWEEIRNFMKCLIKMFAQSDRGVLFYETVLSFKYQKHTYIEAVPVPWDQWEDAPAYFKESILASETEWSQHKKLINFADRPGGFRRSLVPNLPYFMVQWDYKGEKGYGHVIEGVSDSSAKAGDGEDMGAVDEGDKGGGEFPRYFAAEIIGGMLELEPRKWRKPRRVDSRQDKARIDKFLKAGYAKHDWTGMLGRQG